MERIPLAEFYRTYFLFTILYYFPYELIYSSYGVVWYTK